MRMMLALIAIATAIFQLSCTEFCLAAGQDVPKQPAKSDSQQKAPAVDEFVAVEEMPELIQQVAPVYPDSARRKGITGELTVKMLVNKEGNVDSVIVSKREGGVKEFEKAAIDAAKQWKFKPAKSDGKAVLVWISTKIVFKLK